MNKGLLYIYIVALLLPAGFSCSPQEAGTGDHVALFYREEPRFQQLVASLQADPFGQRHQGQLLFWKAFANPTKKRLHELGITHVRLYAGGRHMDLKTNWSPAHPVYLCYREAGPLPARHEPFTLLHPLNASWALWTKNPS